MASKKAAQLVAQYDRGNLTPHETVVEFVWLAAKEAPASFAAAIPDELLDEVRERCRRPPSDPSQSPRTTHSNLTREQLEVWDKRTMQDWYDGAWAWHHFFESEPPRIE